MQTDVADESSCERMAAEAVAAFGAIHILVNNAAIFILRGIDATPEEWRQMLDVNVMGPALVAKHVVPAIRQAGGGAIVNLASISSFIAAAEFRHVQHDQGRHPGDDAMHGHGPGRR